MIINDTYIPGVTIWKLKGKDDKFLVRKDSSFYYIRDGQWRQHQATQEFIDKLPIYRYSSYSNKSFQPHKKKIFDFILSHLK